MPPKADKNKKKEPEEPKGKFPPIQITFKITEIENFTETEYSEYNIIFSHNEIPLLIVGEDPILDNPTILKQNPADDGSISPLKSYLNQKPHIISNLYKEYYFMFDRNTINDMNKLCDTPLFVGLYGLEELPIENPADRISITDVGNKNDKKGKKQTNVIPRLTIQKNRVLLAYNFIDMLHWIRMKPINITEDIYLYFDPIVPQIPTPLIHINVQSKKRLLLKEIEFPNLCIITLESIFNLNKSLEDIKLPSKISSLTHINKSIINRVANKIIVNFSFIKMDEHLNQIKEPFCSFKNGHYSSLNNNEFLSRKWDSIPELFGTGAWTNIPATRPFKPNLFQEGEYFNLSKYDQDCEVYTFNSMHRYLMTTEFCTNLENLINEEMNQIIIEIKYDDLDEIELFGYVDLSPLLYPGVTTGRFLVTLGLDKISSPIQNSSSKKTIKSTTNKGKPSIESKTDILLEEKNIDKTIFLTFEMRFHTPITNISKIYIDPEIFRISEPNEFEPPKPTISEIASNTLINFENEVLTIVKQLPKYLTGQIIDGEIICKDNSCKECLLAMQSNLVDNISKLISCIYNVQYPTRTNSEFRNLMTIVYNELIIKIDKIINDYYLGIDNSARVIDDPAIKNLKIFIYWESREVIEFIGKSWMTTKPDEIFNANDLLDVIMTNLHYYNFEEVNKRLDQLLKRNHAHYYGLLVRLYLIYLKSETEEFLPELLKVIEIHPYKLKLWSILYAIYDNANYRAGSKYCKMRYTTCHRIKPYFWDRIFIFFCQPKNLSDWKPLCDCVYFFLKIGLFKFAELVYEKCKNQFEPIEGIRLVYLCKYFLRDYDGLKHELESTNITPDTEFIIKLFWGHYYFETGNKKLAKINYELFFHIEYQNRLLYDHLAFLRCGFMEIIEKNYENAETYFVVCVRETNSMIAWYGLGICLFRSNKFLKSRQCFSKVTTYKWVKLPETWLYLAMISVKLKDFDLAKKFMGLAQMSAETTIYGLDTELWNETNSLLKENFINIHS